MNHKMKFKRLKKDLWNKQRQNKPEIEITGRKTNERKKLQEKYRDKTRYTPHLNNATRWHPNKNTPYLCLHQYNEGFSFQLVDLILRNINQKEKNILDPYCGVGTTLFTAAYNQTKAHGFDTLPMATHISNTILKYPTTNLKQTEKQTKKIIDNLHNLKPTTTKQKIPPNTFPPKNLLELKKIRTGIQNTTNRQTKQTLLALYISIINPSSNTDNTGKTLTINPNKKPQKPTKLLKKRLKTLKKSRKHPLPKNTKKYLKTNKCTQQNTTKTIKTKTKPNIIITSPPYPDKYNYQQKYQLEHTLTWPNQKNPKQTTTTTNTKITHPATKETINSIKTETPKDKQTKQTLKNYFQNLTKALKNTYNTTQKQTHAIYITENLNYKNETIPLDLIITDISQKHGYKPKTLKTTWTNKNPNPNKYKKHQNRTIIHLTKNT
nr:DNA methyltransferase [Methanonatronarchaeum sp. AMET6-2]